MVQHNAEDGVDRGDSVNRAIRPRQSASDLMQQQVAESALRYLTCCRRVGEVEFRRRKVVVIGSMKR